MRISDWSSDVCSSDLTAALPTPRAFSNRLNSCRVDGPASPHRSRVLQGFGLLGPVHYRRRWQSIDHGCLPAGPGHGRSEEHTSELQSLMRISYAVFCLKKKKKRYSTENNRELRLKQKQNDINITNRRLHNENKLQN